MQQLRFSFFSLDIYFHVTLFKSIWPSCFVTRYEILYWRIDVFLSCFETFIKFLLRPVVSKINLLNSWNTFE